MTVDDKGRSAFGNWDNIREAIAMAMKEKIVMTVNCMVAGGYVYLGIER